VAQSNISQTSPEWRAIRKRIVEKMDAAKDQCSMHGLPIAETEYQRGKIDALDELLRFVEPRKRNTTEV